MGNLTLQAQSLGLFLHQMGGFDADKARTLYNIPEDYEPVAAIAVGYPGNVNQLDADLQQRELSPRSRKPLTDFVFSGTWEKSYF